MKYKISFAYIFFFLFVGSAFAQVKVVYSEDFKDGEITSSQKAQIREALNSKFNEYVKYAKLINPDTRKIDRESVRLFKELFTLDAKLFNDIREVPEAFLYPVDGYVGNARNYFTFDGLQYGINSAKIKSLEYNSYSSRYTATLEVSKSIERFYTESGTTEYGTKTYDLEFLYTFKMDDLDNARILTIRPSSIGGIADVYTQMYNLSLGAAYGIPSFSETPLYQAAAEEGTLDLEPGFEFSLGINWYSNFFNKKEKTDKKLFFAIGVTGFYQEIKGVLENYQTSAPVGGISGVIPEGGSSATLFDSFGRRASNVNVEEVHSIFGARVPLGLSFRLLNTNTSSAFLSVQYAPSLIVSHSGELNGTGDYDLDDAVPLYADLSLDFDSGLSNAYKEASSGYTDFENAYKLGETRPLNSKPELSPSFNHGILFSGLFFKDLIDDNPTYGMGLGLHFYLPLTDPWENDLSQERPLWYYDDADYVDPGVISPFMESVRLSHVGLSLNIFYKRNKQP